MDSSRPDATRRPPRAPSWGAVPAWGPLHAAGFLGGHLLAARAASAGLPLPPPAGGFLLDGLLCASVLSAAYLLWLPLTWLSPGVSRRFVARGLAAPLGWSLLFLGPLLSPAGDRASAALALAASAAWAGASLGARAGAARSAAAAAAALLAAGALFMGPARLFSSLGPALGTAALPAALLVSAAVLALAARPLRFSERYGPALLAAAVPFGAGAAWHGWIRPAILYRKTCLAPTALLGTDGSGGVFMRNRTGAVYLARPESLRRLDLPARARLGPARSAGGLAAVLELRRSGDVVWLLGPAGARPLRPGRGDGEAFFAADIDLDDGRVVAADALNPRLVWLDGSGRVVRSVLAPPRAGSPRLVSASGGSVHVMTDGGRLLVLSPEGAWRETAAEAPPGRPLSLAASADGDRLVAARGRTARAYRLTPVPGAPAVWTAIGAEGKPGGLAVDGAGRVFALSGGGAEVIPAAPAGPRSRLGAPPELLGAFLSSPGGRLIEGLR